MQKVRRIPALALVAFSLVAACSVPSIPSQVPISIPEADSPVEKREPSVPEGFIGDRMDRVFHRMGCPRFNADPSQQMFFVTPFDALNDSFEPCKYCDPMRGWQ